MHTNNKPTRCNRAAVVPFLWADVLALLDTWSIRVTDPWESEEWDDVALVHDEIEAVIDRQDLRPGLNYAVPLRHVCGSLSRRHIPDGAPHDHRRIHEETRWAQKVLVNALNTPDNGLELVRPRRLSLAS